MSNTIGQIEQRIADSREQLIETLGIGGDTTELRATIAALTTELEAAVEADAHASRAATQQRQASIDLAGENLSATSHQTVAAAAVVDGLEQALAGAIPAIETDPLIESTSQALAVAQSALEAASATHTKLAAAATRLRTALVSKNAELVELKARRAAGKSKSSDALEALGLPDDIADLERAVAEATEKALAAVPNAERAKVAAAQQHLDEAVSAAKLRTLRKHMVLVENAYLAVYRELRAAEHASSEFLHRPSGAYRANADLKAIVARH